MNKSIPYLQNNASFNPLFAKMKERFCADGTLAERMAQEAGLYKKQSKKNANEYHMTHANSLPKRTGVKKGTGKIKSFFSLQRMGVVSMMLLVLGTIFFSGASLQSIATPFSDTDVSENGNARTESDITITQAYVIAETGLGFADEAIIPYL